MKRVIPILLILLLLFSGSAKQTEISREEIVSAYQNAGYSVWTGVYDAPLDEGEIAYVQANHPDGDYIYFSFFETPQQAKEFKDTYYHPGMMGLFSVIFGDPSWQRWKVHGCIVVQYDEPEFYEVFLQLINSK